MLYEERLYEESFVFLGLTINRGGDSPSGRRDVGQNREREAGGDLKFIWDVGGRLTPFSGRDAGGHNIMTTGRRDVGEKQV